MAKSTSLTVCLTGAAGQIAYSLIPLLCDGSVFGDGTTVNLNLLDVTPALQSLEGVAMEIEDAGFDHVGKVLVTDSADEAFDDADYAVLVGGFPREKGMRRADLLARNAAVLQIHGRAMARRARPRCHALVVANPANANALAVARCAPHLARAGRVTALTLLDQRRAEGLARRRLREAWGAARFHGCAGGRGPGGGGGGGGGVGRIRNAIIWGNHSATQVVDLGAAEVEIGGRWHRVLPMLRSAGICPVSLAEECQRRGAAVLAARGRSSAASAAAAAAAHLRALHRGTAPGEVVCMAVLVPAAAAAAGERGGGGGCGGNPYGLPGGLCYSVPVRCAGGGAPPAVAGGLGSYEFRGAAEAAALRAMRAATLRELEEERSELDKIMPGDDPRPKL